MYRCPFGAHQSLVQLFLLQLFQLVLQFVLSDRNPVSHTVLFVHGDERGGSVRKGAHVVHLDAHVDGVADRVRDLVREVHLFPNGFHRRIDLVDIARNRSRGISLQVSSPLLERDRHDKGEEKRTYRLP